jgi:hypothetical protein
MFNNFFGFDRKTEEDETLEINVQETFFRYICCKVGHRGDKLFAVVIAILFIIGGITLISSMETYHRLCRDGNYHVVIGPNCNITWFGTVNNQTLFTTCLYLMLTFTNLACIDNNKNNPWMVDLQWKLATGLMPNSMTAFVYYYVVVYPGSTNVDIFSFGVWFCTIIMYFVTGLCGLYETRVRHFMWSTSTLLLMVIGSLIPNMMGNKVFILDKYDGTDIFLYISLLLAINICFHAALLLAFKIKTGKHGWWGYSKVKVSFEIPPTDVELGA